MSSCSFGLQPKLLMSVHQGKIAAAQRALDVVCESLTPETVLGIGTGTTVNCFIDLLSRHKHLFYGAVATSADTTRRLRQHSIKLLDLNEVSIKHYVDGADEADSKLQLIKGGHGALLMEKIVASAADTFICIADSAKKVDQLGTFPLPIEVLEPAREYVSRQLVALGGVPQLRANFQTNHNNQLLVVSGLDFNDPKALETAINDIPGVIGCGIFAHRPADVLYLGSDTGVECLTR